MFFCLTTDYLLQLNQRVTEMSAFANNQTCFDGQCGLLLVAQISYLEVEVETLTEQLHSPKVCEEGQNGSVTVDDLDHIQKVNRELEQQLSDKNRVSQLY